jgi:hypothetical protein
VAGQPTETKQGSLGPIIIRRGPFRVISTINTPLTTGRQQCLVNRVMLKYNARIFIGNQTGGHVLLSTIISLVTYVATSSLEYSPLGAITCHHNGVKYSLNKHTINSTLGWGSHMGPSRTAGHRVGPFHSPRR